MKLLRYGPLGQATGIIGSRGPHSRSVEAPKGPHFRISTLRVRTRGSSP